VKLSKRALPKDGDLRVSQKMIQNNYILQKRPNSFSTIWYTWRPNFWVSTVRESRLCGNAWPKATRPIYLLFCISCLFWSLCRQNFSSR
jgi:hypothetical protein